MKNDRIYTREDMSKCWVAAQNCDTNVTFDNWIETHNKSYTTEKKKYVEEELPYDPDYSVDMDMDVELYKCPKCKQTEFDGLFCYACGENVS